MDLVGLFGRQPERRPGRVLLASGARIDLSDKKVALRARKYRQGWQSEAWQYSDTIGELGYAHRFKGNACSRMRLFAAAQDPDDPKAPPIPIGDAKGIDAKMQAAATAALERLGAGRLASAALLNPFSVNFSVAGECYLVGRQDSDAGETWEIRSIDEMVSTDKGWHLRELPTDFTESQAANSEPLGKDDSYVARLWTPHPRFRVLADSPMRAILEISEELLLLSRGIRAAAKSRSATNGILYIPDELSLAQAEESDDNPTADPFMAMFTQALTAPILDETAPSAVVPLVLRGPADLAQALVHIQLDREVDKTGLDARAELIRRLAIGIDLPPEIVLGTAEANHWSAWSIDDSTFRQHIEPQVLTMVDSLTAGFMWPALAADGFAPADYRRVCIWYDPTELVTHPDRTADALQLWDRNAISDEALRAAAGFADADRPTDLEIVQRLISHARSWPANLQEALVHRLDPTLEIPADKSEPGYGPGGEIEAPEDATPAGGQKGQPEQGPPPKPVGDGAPPAGKAGPAGPAAASVHPIRALAAAAPPPAAPHRAGIQLADADRDLLVRLHTAADSEMRRALERAGARVRTKVRASSAHAAAIRDVPNVAVCASLGPDVVASFAADQDPAWADLQAHWGEWVAATLEFSRGRARRLAADLCHATATRTGRCTVSEQDLDALAAEQARHAQDGWRWLEAAMTGLFRRLLYSPAPGSVALPGQPGRLVGGSASIVPLRLVRAALALAGGYLAGGLSDDGVPVDATVPMGGAAAGGDVLEFLARFGVTPAAWEWRHGHSGTPFEPHLDLDGLIVTGPDDPRLANTDSFPDAGHYYIGDHEGCGCQMAAVFGAGAVLGQAA